MASGKSKLLKPPSRKINPPPPWIELPDDVTANILHRLGAIEIIESAQKVCTTWRNVCKDPQMWRVIDMWNLGDLFNMPYNLEKMCRHADDRSQGQLVDINIEYFGTDELLDYITQRPTQLECLRIAHSYGISGEELSKAVAKFPLLEEVHLIFEDMAHEDVEAIGYSCPKLKSFTYNQMGFRKPIVMDDGLALAVARSMPGLHHLSILGDKITNQGLQAILDGCQHLESLDLRKCFNIVLDGDLEKRCSQQIKNLRRPLDSKRDYGWVADVEDANMYQSGSYGCVAGDNYLYPSDSSYGWMADFDDEDMYPFDCSYGWMADFHDEDMYPSDCSYGWMPDVEDEDKYPSDLSPEYETFDSDSSNFDLSDSDSSNFDSFD